MPKLRVAMLGAMRRLAPLAALALVLATVALQLSVAPARDPGRRPNVVVIVTDDQTVGDMSVMPRTRRLLGTRGVTFTNSFVSYPLCCPSRATYLTGQYAHNHGVWGNRPPLGGYGRLREAHVLPVWLERAGYVTGHGLPATRGCHPVGPTGADRSTRPPTECGASRSTRMVSSPATATR
jgi:N-acetylglucosamine-6-sulfatase